MAAVVQNSLPRRRKCGSRVRNGCQNCKSRRVKCDQKKPACLNCSNIRETCTYSDPFRSICIDTSYQFTSKTRISGITPPRSIDSSVGLPLDVQGRSSFYYFRCKASCEISSLLSDNFWNSYLLPMSVSCESVQHAIVALATQHRKWIENRAAQSSTSSAGSASPFHSYGNAIRSLNRQIGEWKNGSPVVEETLVTCLLLICFNVLQGNDVDALKHLEAGLQIYNRYLPSLQRQSRQLQQLQHPIQELTMSFKRLDLQAALYIGSYQIKFLTPNNAQSVETSLLQNEHPIDFTSITEARHALDDLICSGFHFMRSKAEPIKYPGGVDQDEDGLKRRNVTCQRDNYIKQLQRWGYLFQRLQSIAQHQWNNGERANASKHWICYNVNLISLSVCLSPDQATYDQFQPEFKEILQLVEQVLAPSRPSCSEEHGQQSNPVFDLEMALIQPLYFTALKCREPDIRNRSIDLLQKCGKEGVWDGDIMARVARHVVGYEESQRCLDPLTGASEISEQYRICGTAINLMRTERKIWIRCSTRRWCSREADMLKETTPRGDKGYAWEFHEEIIYL